MKLTRREIPSLLAAPAIASAQKPASEPGQEMAAARETLRRNSEALAKFDLPRETEPAFQFKA